MTIIVDQTWNNDPTTNTTLSDQGAGMQSSGQDWDSSRRGDNFGTQGSTGLNTGGGATDGNFTDFSTTSGAGGNFAGGNSTGKDWNRDARNQPGDSMQGDSWNRDTSTTGANAFDDQRATGQGQSGMNDDFNTYGDNNTSNSKPSMGDKIKGV